MEHTAVFTEPSPSIEQNFPSRPIAVSMLTRNFEFASLTIGVST